MIRKIVWTLGKTHFKLFEDLTSEEIYRIRKRIIEKTLERYKERMEKKDDTANA